MPRRSRRALARQMRSERRAREVESPQRTGELEIPDNTPTAQQPGCPLPPLRKYMYGKGVIPVGCDRLCEGVTSEMNQTTQEQLFELQRSNWEVEECSELQRERDNRTGGLSCPTEPRTDNPIHLRAVMVSNLPSDVNQNDVVSACCAAGDGEVLSCAVMHRSGSANNWAIMRLNKSTEIQLRKPWQLEVKSLCSSLDTFMVNNHLSPWEYEDEECMVCLEPLGGMVAETVCNHLFHQECIVVWFNSQPEQTCPVCRTMQA